MWRVAGALVLVVTLVAALAVLIGSLARPLPPGGGMSTGELFSRMQ